MAEWRWHNNIIPIQFQQAEIEYYWLQLWESIFHLSINFLLEKQNIYFSQTAAYPGKPAPHFDNHANIFTSFRKAKNSDEISKVMGFSLFLAKVNKTLLLLLKSRKKIHNSRMYSSVLIQANMRRSNIYFNSQNEKYASSL